ncbi:MAG: heat shock protein transcriptional repressor HspR [Nitriliruptorales bacterium]
MSDSSGASGSRQGMSDGRDDAVYVISVAAELAGVHPQTLRGYEREGLVTPRRSTGNVRRYSDQDVELLNEIQRLTQEEGLNLAGVRMVLELREALIRARRRAAQLERDLEALRERLRDEVEAAHRSHRFEIVPVRRAQVEVYRRETTRGQEETR